MDAKVVFLILTFSISVLGMLAFVIALIQKQVLVPTSAARSIFGDDEQVYTTTCQACHQATGAGIPGAFPPLAESDWVSGPPKRLAAIVLHGLQGEINVKGQKFQGVMPPFKDQLKPEDIAAVATYVRNSFGNKADLVTVEVVNQVKQATASKATSWNGESDLNTQNWD